MRGWRDRLQWTLYWRTGQRQFISGPTIKDAVSRAGFGGGAFRALDFYAEGIDDNWCWTGKEWRPTLDSAHAIQCGYCAGAGTDKAGQRCGGCNGTGVPAIARRAGVQMEGE